MSFFLWSANINYLIFGSKNDLPYSLDSITLQKFEFETDSFPWVIKRYEIDLYVVWKYKFEKKSYLNI